MTPLRETAPPEMGILVIDDEPAVMVRPMLHRDLPGVLDIERQKSGRKWGRQDFKPVLCTHLVEGLVAVLDYAVVGHLVIWRDRDFIALLNIAVATEWRRRGIARTLLQKLTEDRSRNVRAIVAESNLAGQLLLKDSGFKAVVVLRGHCHGEDAYVMVRPAG